MILQMFAISCFTIGLFKITREGMIFGFIEKSKAGKLPFLFGCPICMSSFWGTPIYILLNKSSLAFITLLQLPIVLIGSCFTTWLLTSLIYLIEKYSD